jgi:hypothetical protein
MFIRSDGAKMLCFHELLETNFKKSMQTNIFLANAPAESHFFHPTIEQKHNTVDLLR